METWIQRNLDGSHYAVFRGRPGEIHEVVGEFTSLEAAEDLKLAFDRATPDEAMRMLRTLLSFRHAVNGSVRL